MVVIIAIAGTGLINTKQAVHTGLEQQLLSQAARYSEDATDI
ncbi:MAG: hypothetical protein AAF974_03415 [Cyanobacteria bacterium P01_E01_bin.34]